MNDKDPNELPTLDEAFDDLNEFSLEMHRKSYGTTESREAARATRKAQRKDLREKYPHLECYSMSEKESDSAAIFWDEHECKYRGQYRGAIGGGNSVIFMPNSIGQVVIVKCYCGAEKDVSDYEW
jgi:hypothetical protein